MSQIVYEHWRFSQGLEAGDDPVASVEELEKICLERGGVKRGAAQTHFPDPPVPKALSPRAPFNVVVIAEPSSPPQDPRPHPKPFC